MSGRHRTPTPDAVLTATGLSRTFGSGEAAVHAVRGADVTLYPGEVVALAGTSGSGKSTLLAMLIGWERPDEGSVLVGAGDPAARTWDELAVLPQTLGLLEDLTVRENVLLPARIAGKRGDFVPRAQELTDRLGIARLADRLPGETSLGEQQRCALARALLLRPTLVIGDEPTAHQDHANTAVMVAAMREEAAAGATFLIATHDPEVWTLADRILRMRDGRLTDEASDG